MRSKQFFPVLPPTESSVSEFWRHQHKLNSKVTFLIKSQSWGTLAAVRAAFACSKLQQRKLHGRRALGLRGCPKTEGSKGNCYLMSGGEGSNTVQQSRRAQPSTGARGKSVNKFSTKSQTGAAVVVGQIKSTRLLGSAPQRGPLSIRK